MLQFMSHQSAAIKEAEDLREKLRHFDGATPVRALDPALVLPSKWANRHADSFADAEFEALKQEIAGAGGNVQPIRVRPLPAGTRGGNGLGEEERFEIVFGHRRHRACLELGLLVQAQIESVDDRQLFELMDRENRGRKNLSAWEQGVMYRRALDEGLYPSLRKLAEALKVDVSLVSKSVALARLPEAVVRAFPSPVDIQFRWAQPLCEWVQKDPDALLARARDLQDGQARTAIQVFEQLTRPPEADEPAMAARNQEHKLGHGQRSALMTVGARGDVKLKFSAKALRPERREALKECIERFLAED
ncbi:ParB/RepB/Spo0J family partition protein [Ideonella livida]|uniref:ParB/RepB/Spo0J family partition protein n=1 Tax=Ideonella livida TaxID=2707176 RepID=A0A7C9TLX3_9BURK|nr:ParB/RepB/Spo0J family partition protein [Ideonella livida]NDY93621.1 ParB/RepB/Spo0J family partition protein [Ideonella livida]